MAEIISYQSQGSLRGWRRWMNRRNGLIVCCSILLMAFIPMPRVVSRDQKWLCAICASERGEISWPMGVTTNQTFKQSSLDNWISQRGGHVHDWRSVRCSLRDVFGRYVGTECGTAPQIYGFSADLQSDYMKSASAEQIAAFVQTMQSGTDAQQRQAVDQAVNQAIDGMAAGASTMPSVDPLKR